MRKDRFAVILLEMVTTRARASSLIGDLRETAPARGESWFWWSVLRSGAGLVSESTSARFGELCWIGLLGVVVGWTLEFCTSAMYSLGLLGWCKVMGYPNTMLYPPQTPSVPIHPWWTDSWLALVMFFSIRFLIGKWIASGAAGRELPACLVFEVMEIAIAFVIMAALHVSSQGFLVPGMGDLSCLAGALSMRRRRMEMVHA